MTSYFSRLKNHFVHWREWELNPVVVKELRQSVRSWAVTGVLLLFLGVLFFTALGFLVGQSFETNEDRWLGGRVFQAFLTILTLASVTFIPLYVAIKIAVERNESNLDLLYVTSLTPQRIIRGKFFCGAYMAVLFFSACMPFMVFTNLLRGIDLPTVFFILLCLFLAVCGVTQAAIFVACLPISRLLKILLALFGTGFTFGLTRWLSFVFSEMARSGVGSMMAERDFWIGFSTSVSLLIAGILLLYFLSVALISPLSANRALPLRVYLTVAWLFSGLLSVYWARKEHLGALMAPWATTTFTIMIAAMLVVISNDDQLSPRVRRDIPAGRGRRALAFLFYNGAAGGLIWVALLVGIAFGVTDLFLRFPNLTASSAHLLSPEELIRFEWVTGSVLLYAFAYALTALFLHRQLWGRRSPKLAGILAILLPGAWALLPTIVFFFWNRLSWARLEQNQLGNIFNVLIVKEISQRHAHLFCAAAWVLLMIVLNAKWFVRQYKRFQPLPPAMEPPVITGTSTPLPTSVH